MSDTSRPSHPDDITPAEREELQVAAIDGELADGHARLALRLADELEREDHRTAAMVMRSLLERAFPEMRGRVEAVRTAQYGPAWERSEGG